jgi:hypothetical protein
LASIKGVVMKAILAALLMAAATPVCAQAAEPPKAESIKDKASDLDLSKMMSVLEKLFPAQPDPAPGRLALAKVTADGMLPPGTYSAMFDEMMGSVVDRILSLSDADLGADKDKEKGASSTTLRQEIAKEDPYFDERMKIMQRVIREELVKISAVMEPKLREGLSRSIARRFDEKQLTEINAFIATDAGKSFAAQTMRMWMDPEVMRSMAQTIPHMVTALPGAMARLDAETSHLPKPKKKTEEKVDDEPTT